jgi:hypothetical protein
MGKLALAGALAGAGKGLQEMGQDRMEAEAAAAKQSHDDARQEALIRLKARLEKEARQETFAQEEKIQNIRGEQAKELQTGEQQFKGSEAEKTRQFEAVQTDKELESREKVAGIKATDKDAGKWKITTKTRGGNLDPATGMITGAEEYTTITSPVTGITYEQQGDMFLPQDPDARSKIRRPAKMKEALAWVRENPKENAQKFLGAYGWLPASVMRYLVD